MKKLTFGIATVAVLLTAVPAMAQVGVRVGPVGVGIGAPGPYYGGCGYGGCGGYYDQYNGSAVVVGGRPGWHGHARYHGYRR
jgi:hypothetical protein